MTVNLTKNQDEITSAWRQVVDSKTTQKWALFGYEGNTNNIKLMASGEGGLKELVQEFNCSMIQYAFCRVIVEDMNLNKLILINWQGDSSPLSRKGLCASHVGDVVDYFKGCTQTITIRNDDEATEEYLMDQILKTLSSSRISLPRQHSQQKQSSSHTVDSSSGSSSIGSKKLDINSELALDRKSFWQRQEEEEKERLLEEKKRAAEKQAQFERERKQREESEAKKLAETIKERDRLIEATRQAEKRDSSSGFSQPSSILTTNANEDNEDERVGRRSELIRLERNQETLSLIGKGLIKNKRAIFEQASQQQQQNQSVYNSNTARRGSGAMISQRLNSFKSLDHSGSTSSNTSVEKLANGFPKQINLEENINTTARKEVETVRIVNEQPKQLDSTPKEISTAPEQAPSLAEKGDELPQYDTNSQNQPTPKLAQPPLSEVESTITANNDVDANGNENSEQMYKSTKQEPEIKEIINGEKYGTRAKALYDYQAADSTEICFDPDDIIGFIEKVDEGWWHGTVVTGTYKGQCGLFPANHVEELI